MVIKSVSTPSSFASGANTTSNSFRIIGSSDDAILLQSMILTETTDRLRNNIQKNLATATQFINSMELLSAKLEKFGKYLQNNWVPVTYASLQSTDKNSVALRTLFANDGPNLGDSLEQSEAVLAEFGAEGISLNAPRQTPVMFEQFLANNGKVDLTKPPASFSLNWRSDQDVKSIDAGQSPGSFPGSVEKVVEQRDANGKLTSVIRYTVFVDYANLRPMQVDLAATFSSYLEKMGPVLDDMAILLSQILKDVTSLDQRVKLESANNTEGRKKIFENEQRMIDSLLEARRLLKTFLSDLSKTKSSIEISDNRPIDQKNASYFSQDSSEAINGSQESPNAIDGLQDLLRVIRSGSGDASESLREIIRGEHRWSLDDKSRLSDIRDDVLAFRPMLQALERALQKPLSLTLISQSD